MQVLLVQAEDAGTGDEGVSDEVSTTRGRDLRRPTATARDSRREGTSAAFQSVGKFLPQRRKGAKKAAEINARQRLPLRLGAFAGEYIVNARACLLRLLHRRESCCARVAGRLTACRNRGRLKTRVDFSQLPRGTRQSGPTRDVQ